MLIHGSALTEASGGSPGGCLRSGALVIMAAYYVVNWTRSGQTFGMRAWRLRTVERIRQAAARSGRAWRLRVRLAGLGAGRARGAVAVRRSRHLAAAGSAFGHPRACAYRVLEIATSVQKPIAAVGSQPTSTGFRPNSWPPFSTVRSDQKEHDAEHHADHRAGAGAGGAQRAENERQRQQRHDHHREDACDARPVADFVVRGIEAVAAQMVDIRGAGPRSVSRSGSVAARPRKSGLTVERMVTSLTSRCRCGPRRSGSSRRCACANGPDRRPKCGRRAGWTATGSRPPARTEIRRRTTGRPRRSAPCRMRLPSFTHALLEPAKLTSASLLVVFSRLANCASGGATYSPMAYMVERQGQAREAHRPGDAPHRNARSARDHEFAARGQIAEPHERADQRRDGQQLEDLLRQVEEGEQEGIARPCSCRCRCRLAG